MKNRTRSRVIYQASLIFTKLMLFYFVLVLVGWAPNPGLPGNHFTYPSYVLLAAAFAFADALLWRFPQWAERQEQESETN